MRERAKQRDLASEHYAAIRQARMKEGGDVDEDDYGKWYERFVEPTAGVSVGYPYQLADEEVVIAKNFSSVILGEE